MTIDEIRNEILEQKPGIVYLSGKTCTGKTTFARELQNYGYKLIELDPVVAASVVPFYKNDPSAAFIPAYRDEGPAEHVEAFIEAARKEIQEKNKLGPLVIEGAIAKSRILKEIFSGKLEEFFFVYFQPVHLAPYMERLQSRFVAGAANNTSGLPKYFWSLVQQADLDEFLSTGNLNEGLRNTIREYAQSSMAESSERLLHLQESFSNIKIVGV
jgi:hypothetical protein